MGSIIRNIGLISVGALMTALTLSTCSLAQTTGRNVVMVRGQQQEIYYYPATGTKLDRKVLFVPGDGGWRGWAITVARQMASWGYDVYGLDTKTYLESFTRTTRLRENDVSGDFRQLAQWMAGGGKTQVTLVGWSEGAGLSVLAATDTENQRVFNGLVTFGLGDENVLGWCWKDNITYITGARPNEPTFRVRDHMAKIAPLPYLMIQSSRDEYVTSDEAKSLATAAKEPKRLRVIQASNHRFDGNTDEFYHTLREGLQWMK